jgi:hypothetical protein
VTRTAFPKTFTPRSIAVRTSSLNFNSLAATFLLLKNCQLSVVRGQLFRAAGA